MRFFLTAAAWLLMLGGLSLYVYQRDRQLPPPQAPPGQTVSAQEFTLEITPTFSPEPDPFAVLGDEGAGAPLVVRTAERVLFRAEALEPLVAVEVYPLRGLLEGLNEFYVQAQPPYGEATRRHAVRLRLLQGGRVLVDETLWAESGANVAGSVPFVLRAAEEERHEH